MKALRSCLLAVAVFGLAAGLSAADKTRQRSSTELSATESAPKGLNQASGPKVRVQLLVSKPSLGQNLQSRTDGPKVRIQILPSERQDNNIRSRGLRANGSGPQVRVQILPVGSE